MINIKKITDVLAQVRSLVSSLAVTTVIFALVIILVRQLSNNAIIVEPIKVPSSLAALGFTPEVTAKWVLEDMLEIQRKATTRKEGQLIAPEWERFDMEVPGSGITLSALGRAMRESLGIHEKKISGEAVKTEKGYQLRLRLSGGARFIQEPILTSKSNVDAMIHAAAEHAVQLIEPFMFASYLHASGRTEDLKDAIRYCLENGADEDRKWVYNLRGIMLAEQSKFEEAVKSYSDALKQDNRFALTYYNMANALYKLEKYELSLDNFLKAVSLDSGLHDAPMESALRFNVGFIYGKDPARTLEDEIEMYRLALKSNPEETQALMFWGIALMREPNPDFEAAAEKFAVLTNKDNKNAQAYAKWGEALEGLADYSKAIEKYQAAIEADPSGYKFLKTEIDRLQKRLTQH